MATDYTVLGLDIRIWDREDWQIPSEAIHGPDPTPELVRWGVCHYPGASRSWVPPLDTAAHLRWANHLYLTDPNRGYSYGYLFVIGANPIDWFANPVVFDTWEVRGFDFRAAANNGDFPPWSSFQDPNFNGRSMPVQVMCSWDHPPTDDQRMQFRYMMALGDQVYGETLSVQEHRVSDQTDCAGPCGQFMHELVQRPPRLEPAPKPTPQEDDKLMYVTKVADRFRVGDTIWAREYGPEQIDSVIAHATRDSRPLVDIRTGNKVSERSQITTAQAPGMVGKIVSDADDAANKT